MFSWEPLGPGIQVNATLTRTNHPNIVAGQVHPLWQWHSRMAVASPSRMCPATLLLRNGPRNTTKTSRYQPGLQIPQNLIRSSICGMCRTWLWPVDTWTQQLAGGVLWCLEPEHWWWILWILWRCVVAMGWCAWYATVFGLCVSNLHPHKSQDKVSQQNSAL